MATPHLGDNCGAGINPNAKLGPNAVSGGNLACRAREAIVVNIERLTRAGD
jgi:hypothetical protein